MAEQDIRATSSLVDLLSMRAEFQKNDLAYVFLEYGGKEEQTLSYYELDQKARAIASKLQQNLNPGDRVLLLYSPGLEFVCSFLGCLYAKMIAVSAFPPRNKKHMPRLYSMIDDCSPKLALTSEDILPKLKEWFQLRKVDSEIKVLASDSWNAGDAWEKPDINGEDLAFLQYTSGSTSAPKGVMISHSNILHNAHCIETSVSLSRKSVSTSWLPAFHDMGLIDGVLTPLIVGYPAYLMSPTDFIQKPVRWLEAVSNNKTTHCGAPNFAFEMCAEIPQEELIDLDLSHWENVYCGAEPVRMETMQKFAKNLACTGFQEKQIYPVFGMAETTLFISGGELKAPPVYTAFDVSALEQHKIKLNSHENDCQYLVGCGKAVIDTEFKIVHSDSLNVCKSDEVGELWIKSPSVAKGYWQNEEATQNTFNAYTADTKEGPFLRTGDLALYQDEELYITGRLKDLIIINGKNHYPQDIEYTVKNCHPALKGAYGAAFSIDIENDEKLVLIHEVSRSAGRKINSKEILEDIRKSISENHEMDVYDIVLIRHLSIHKTSSGKIQRNACKDSYLKANFTNIASLRQSKEFENKSPDESNKKRIKNEFQTEQSKKIEKWLLDEIACAKKMKVDEIDLFTPLTIYGVNSILAVQIAGKLQEWLNVEVPPTLLYDCPTVSAISKFLAGEDDDDDYSASIALGGYEEIAIVGMSCSFPGAKDINSFWELLEKGQDAIEEVPYERWEKSKYYDKRKQQKGKMNSLYGGFIKNVDEFDARFFGISPAEAERMDPQQRLLLETSWHAFENAGLSPKEIQDKSVGIFIGASTSDYRKLQFSNVDQLDHMAGTGNAFSIMANRLSYFYDLDGPSMCVDTACSSSLVSFHLACDSLRNGESSLALAGGVNLILNPDLSISFSHANMMAPDGRCKTFDESADGYVRGEGCGFVVLKRLKEAQRDGDRILAVAKSSAVNQDGKSNGLTAPNGRSQSKVIRKALSKAGILAEEVSFVEAHGTGTSLGDPIEVNSLKEVFDFNKEQSVGDDAVRDNCYLGSVKTNIGHLESAAGIAGLIKSVLCLQKQTLVQNLHFKSLNSLMSLDGSRLKILEEKTPWPQGDNPSYAGISSFGFGGTNASVILSSAPIVESDDNEVKKNELLAIAASDEVSLKNELENLIKCIGSSPKATLRSIAARYCFSKSALPLKTFIVADSKEKAIDQLKEISCDLSQLNPVQTQHLKSAYLFSGQGSQYAGMGKELYENFSIIKTHIDDMHDFLFDTFSFDLKNCLFLKSDDLDQEKDQKINHTENTQVALFALEYSLAKFWESLGLKPSVVLGHSVGEVTAACYAGLFSLEDGLRLIYTRGRLMGQLPKDSGMLSVRLNEYKVLHYLRDYGDNLSIAAINGAEQVVVSGKDCYLEELQIYLEEDGVKSKWLRVSHGFHSNIMDPILDEFELCIKNIEFKSLSIPLISNVTGRLINDEIGSTQYWSQQIRKTVRFSDCLHTLKEESVEAFIELGPAPVLLGIMAHELPGLNSNFIPSLKGESGESEVLLNGVGSLYEKGYPINWKALYKRDEMLDLYDPYSFHRQAYWFKALPDQNKVSNKEYPLLGRKLSLSILQKDECLFENQLELLSQEIPNYHSVVGFKIFPATCYMELLIQACVFKGFGENKIIKNLFIKKPIIVDDKNIVSIQSYMNDSKLEIKTEMNEESGWQNVASAEFAEATELGSLVLENLDLEELKSRITQKIDLSDHYQKAMDAQIHYHEESLHEVYTGDQEVLAHFLNPKEGGFTSVLDSALQSVFQLLPKPGKDEIFLLESLEQLQFFDLKNIETQFSCYGNVSKDKSLAIDLFVFNGSQILYSLKGLQFRKVPASYMSNFLSHPVESLNVEWIEKEASNFVSKLNDSAVFYESLSSFMVNIVEEKNIPAYPSSLEITEKIGIYYFISFLKSMGLVWQNSNTFDLQKLIEDNHVLIKYTRLLSHLSSVLVDRKILKQRDANIYEIIGPAISENDFLHLKDLASHNLDCQTEFGLLVACGSSLKEVVLGQKDPLEILFPNGDFGVMKSLYKDSKIAHIINHTAREAVLGFIKGLPKTQKIRILELGAGTGGLTSHLLPYLPADQVEYVFTDISSLFLSEAQSKFSEFSFLDYKILNIENDPSQQDFDRHSFDLIITANVLHATASLKDTLSHSRQLLKPKGAMAIIESTRTRNWLDLSFGLTDGWWSFQDGDLRKGHPLLSNESWMNLFQETGFEKSSFVSPEEFGVDQSLLLAVTPELIKDETPTKIVLIGNDKDSLLKVAKDVSSSNVFVNTCLLSDTKNSLFDFNLNLQDPDFGFIKACDQIVFVGQEVKLDNIAKYWKSSQNLVSALQSLFKNADLTGIRSINVLKYDVKDMLDSTLLISGLIKSLTFERPDIEFKTISYNPTEIKESSIANELLCYDGEQEVSLQNGLPYQRRVKRILKKNSDSEKGLNINFDAVYLITGGLGFLGLQLADWLIERGASELILISRSAPSLEAEKKIKEWRSKSIVITIVSVDVSNESDMLDLYKSVNACDKPLKGIIHAAGIGDFGSFDEMTSEGMHAVMAPKVLGALNLRKYFDERKKSLDFVLLCSSMTSVWGVKNQSAYVSANYFMDEACHAFRVEGFPTKVLNWGPLTGGGLVPEKHLKALEPMGVKALSLSDVSKAMDQVSLSGIGELLVKNDWSILNDFYSFVKIQPVFDLLITEKKVSPSIMSDREGQSKGSSLLPVFEKLSTKTKQLEMMSEFLKKTVQNLLNLKLDTALDPNLGFFDLGLDSLSIMSLKTKIEEALDCELPGTIALEYPSINELSLYLVDDFIVDLKNEVKIVEDVEMEMKQNRTSSNSVENNEELELNHEITEEGSLEDNIATELAYLESLLNGGEDE